MKLYDFFKDVYQWRDTLTIDDLDYFYQIVKQYLPEIKVMYHYDQMDKGHQYDLWEHSYRTMLDVISYQEVNAILMMAALLHDIGKPLSQTFDGEVRHFEGHPIVGYNYINFYLQDKIFEPYQSDEQFIFKYFILHHDDSFKDDVTRENYNDYIFALSYNDFKRLMILHIADASNHIMLPKVQHRLDLAKKLYAIGSDYLYMKGKVE